MNNCSKMSIRVLTSIYPTPFERGTAVLSNQTWNTEDWRDEGRNRALSKGRYQSIRSIYDMSVATDQTALV